MLKTSRFAWPITLVISVVAASLLLVGCGSSDGDKQSSSGTGKSKKVTSTDPDGSEPKGTDDDQGSQKKIEPVDVDLDVTLFDVNGKKSLKKISCVEGDEEKSSLTCVSIAASPEVFFEKPDPNQACTEQYGDARRAQIRGMIDGKRVSIDLARTNGCEIQRWDLFERLWNDSPTPF